MDFPGIGDHRVEVVLSTADTIEASGIFSSLGSSYRQAVAFYRGELREDLKAPKATMVRTLRSYAGWLTGCADLNHPALQSRFGEDFQGFDTPPEFLAACQIHAERVTQLLRDWSDLTSEVLSGFASHITALDLTAVSSEMDQPSAAVVLSNHRDHIDAIMARLPDLCAARACFTGSAALTMDRLESIRDAIKTEASLSGNLTILAASVPLPLAERNELIPSLTNMVAELIEQLGRETTLGFLNGDDPTLTVQTFRDLAKAQRDLTAARNRLSADAGLANLPNALADLALLEPVIVEASDRPLALLDRASIRRAEGRLRNAGFDDVVDWAIGPGRELATSGLADQVAAIIDKNLADAVYDSHGTVLRGYSGEELNEIRKDIASKDRDVIELTRKVVRAKVTAAAHPPAGIGIGRKSDFTEMALIRNELGKRRRRVPIRELTRRSWRSLMDLKPCWMMSPLAVSQFLLPEGLCCTNLHGFPA